MLALVNGSTAMPPAAPEDEEESLVVFAPVFRHVVVVSSMPPPHHDLTIDLLADTREKPFNTTARNLVLNDSVAMAETELARLKSRCPHHHIVLVETTPSSQCFLPSIPSLVDLSARTGISIIKAVPSNNNNNLMIPGLVMLLEDDLFATTITSSSSPAPLFISLSNQNPSSQSSSLSTSILPFLASLPSFVNVILSGVFSQPALAIDLLQSTPDNLLLLVDTKGPCGEFTLLNQTTPHANDQKVAEAVQKAISLNFAHRLVLGLDLVFAMQLRRFGGEGYCGALSFLARLTALGVSQHDINLLKAGNALRVLAYYTPPPPPPPPPIVLLPCAQCGKQLPVTYNGWFDFMDRKFCSSKCMREFKSAMAAAPPPPREDRRTGGAEAGGTWGITIGQT
jgi:hypothetical protein